MQICFEALLQLVLLVQIEYHMNINMSSSASLIFLLVILAILVSISAAQDSRQNPATPTNKRVKSTKPVTQGKNDKNCASIESLANRVESCAKPLINILQGSMEKWPQNENDVMETCGEFAEAERCIRDKARNCATGFRKIIVSTVANSFQRTRKRECVKPKIPGLLKLINCIENHHSIPFMMIANATSRLSVIQDQMKDPDLKTSALCCMVQDIESEMRRLLNPICASEVGTLVKLYRGVLEDAIEIICRNPKCNNVFRGYTIPPIKEADASGLISYILRIVFSLDS